jgi:hypothetical protein
MYFQGQYYTVKTLTDKKLEIYVDQIPGAVSTRYIIQEYYYSVRTVGQANSRAGTKFSPNTIIRGYSLL